MSIYTYASYLGLCIKILHIQHTMLIDPLIHAHQLKHFDRRKWETIWMSLLPKCWVWLEMSIYTYTYYLGLYINFLHIQHTMLIDPRIHAHQLKNFNRRKLRDNLNVIT
jgi:hypothetical protein